MSLTGSRNLQGSFGGSWDLPGTASDHRKRWQNIRNHENRWNWTEKARNGLRIRPFEAHSHFPSIANPPRPQIPPENSPNPHFPKNPKIQKSGNPPGSAAMGGAPLNTKIDRNWSQFCFYCLRIKRFEPPKCCELHGIHFTHQKAPVPPYKM